MASKQSTHLVKIGEHGTLTISMPDMAGQYLLVEQNDATITLRPFDMVGSSVPATIAHCGDSWAMLGLGHQATLRM